MGFDRKFLVWALGYVTVGMAFGLFMAASHNHGQRVTHAHILLVGFVLSFVYSIIHKLWSVAVNRTLAQTQFVVHQAGAIVMFGGLALLYGNVVPDATLDPVLATASITVFIGALLMLYMVLRTKAVRA
jgi:hypothetical protein